VRVVVVGGSVCGLFVALLLSRDGHEVTVLERDAAPLPESPERAFHAWRRPGAPQTRHSHAFLARLHAGLRERAPALLDALLAAGAEPLHFRDLLPPSLAAAPVKPEDDELTLLACRRSTFEWVLRRHLQAHAALAFRAGARVTGLDATPDAATGRPRVRGVVLAGAGDADARLPADLVVDASGRGSKLATWLRAIGAPPLRVEAEQCGIFYSSRFYRLREGVARPKGDGTIGADLGYMKYGIFPGDAGVFSVTLAASPDDAPMRAVLEPASFDAATRVLPATRDWVDSAVSEAITPVYGMGDLRNVRCFPVEAGEPLAIGVVPAGDAWIHTNPLYGRGCTLAWVYAELLAACLARHGTDLRAFARDLDAAVAQQIVPWYETARRQDRDAIEVAEAHRVGVDPLAFEGKDGHIEPRAWMRALLRDGFFPALREDVDLLRAFLRTFNLLTPPEDLMTRPEVLQTIIAHFERRGQRPPAIEGPPREEMLRHLLVAAA
jgi:2-polyprenyl-6-methoxyphenol hydroxylase-like FAD-dependent oxidoreductase